MSQPPLPPQPIRISEIDPYFWGTLKNNSLIPSPGWFRKQPGLVGGSSLNPYTTSQDAVVTENILRGNTQQRWVAPSWVADEELVKVKFI
jgi:hypothetical protein